MFRRGQIILMVVALGAVVEVPDALAQTPTPVEPEILRSLPQVPDQPRSLLEPASGVHSSIPADRPYFAPDPLLDPPGLSSLGWFVDTEVGVTAPSFKSHLSYFVQNPTQIVSGSFNTVGLPSAGLNATVSPRFEVGYMLPSGFGGFALSYRFLATSGSESVAGTDGPTQLSSRVNLNVADLDYISNEFSLWPNWDMRWRVGLRYANVYFDSRSDEAFALAAAGSGVFHTDESNSYIGFGPHTGLELDRRFEGTGLAFYTKAEFSTLIGRIRQNYNALSTTNGPDGQPLLGSASVSSSQAVPVLSLEAGLRWQPANMPHAQFFAGYQYERWWNLGRLSSIDTGGELSDQSFLIRMELNF